MEKLRIDDFTKYTFLSGLEYNPSGTHACFVAHKADLEENGYKSNLWIFEVATNRYFQLTSFDKEKGFIWLDDENILFPGMRNPKDKEKVAGGDVFTVYYKISVNGGEAQEAFRIPLGVTSLKKLDETKFLLTATYNPNRPSLEGVSDEEKANEKKRRKEENESCTVIEEIPFWSNGQGFISMNRNRLYIWDSKDNTCVPITGEKFTVSGLRLNGDKTKAVIIGDEYEGKKDIKNALYILDIPTKDFKQLTPDEVFSYSDAHFLGDKILCLGKDMKTYGLNENAQFYLVDPNTGQRELLTPDFETSTWNSVGSDCRLGGGDPFRLDGDYFYFITTEDESSYLNRIDIQGNIQKVTTAGGSVDSYDVKDGKVIFIGMREHRLQELYSLKDTEEKITGFNDWVNKEKTISPLESLSLETAPGVTIDGWVIKPVGYEDGKKYPAILDIHGGPKTVYGEVFFHEMQYWANEGYFVFFCNPRGSDGKGNEFADIRGKYGTVDYDDIMAFTDAVLAKYPGIDADRVGVTGGSYGGFMTNWIIGHTHRFKAAASQRSISNWVSMGFTTDIGYFFETDQMAADPWGDIDKVWEHSPLKYADRVKTPTLFIHSEEDYRCWTPEALQMFTALRYFGVESRMVLFKGENHELSRSGKPKNRIRRLKEITEWFDKHLK